MLSSDFDGTQNKGDTSNVNQMFEPPSHGLDLYPGALVELKGYDSVGMVHCIVNNDHEQNKSYVYGVELEGPNGSSDGIYDGIRRFTCPQNCAVFVDHSLINRIMPMGSPPRFQSRVHDIYPGDVVLVNKEIGVGIARYVSANLIGIELNVAAGDCDGLYNGNRYFQVQPRHALFAIPQNVKKIHPEDLLNKLNFAVEKLHTGMEG